MIFISETPTSSAGRLIPSDRSLCCVEEPDESAARSAWLVHGVNLSLAAGSVWPQEHCGVHRLQYQLRQQRGCVGSADPHGLLPG